MQFTPYITLDGQCAEAVAFYEKALKAVVITSMRFGDMPNSDHPIPEEAKDRIMHAALEIEGNQLLFSDTFPGMPFTFGDQLSIAISSKDVERLTSIFHALSDGGHVIMELQKTFWSPAYGQIKDKFGITWQISAVGEQQM